MLVLSECTLLVDNDPWTRLSWLSYIIISTIHIQTPKNLNTEILDHLDHYCLIIIALGLRIEYKNRILKTGGAVTSRHYCVSIFLSLKKKKHSNLLGKLNDLCYFEEKRIPQKKIKRKKSYVYYCLFPHQLQFCQHPPIFGLLESQIFSTLAIWLMNIGLMFF